MKPAITIALVLVGILIAGFTLAEDYQDDLYLCTLKTITCGNTIKATVYAYTSEVNQTDNDPFTTANGEKVRTGIVANNCLKFKTKVRINGQIYEVTDRMNKRYDCFTYDIWFEDLQEARNWGKRSLEVEVLD